MIRVRIRRRERVAVALAEDQLFAVRLGRRRAPVGQVWSHSLPLYQQGCDWPELASAFAALRAELGITAGGLQIALLPPLVQVRRVELPRLDDRTLRRVLARDAGRYFPGQGGPQVVGVARLSDGRGSPVPYLVTAADAGLVAGLFEAAASAGWAVDSVVSGYSAWEAGAKRLWPELARETGCLILFGKQRIDVLRLDRGRTSLVRRFGATVGPAAIAASLIEEGPPAVRCGLVGPLEPVLALASELETRGLRVLSTGSGALESPNLFAAVAVGSSRGPQLVPDAVRQEQQGQAARLSARLLTAAAALLVVATGLELWGAQRELAAVQSRRAALHPNVTQAMVVRDEMQGLDATLQALAAAEASRSQWATALVNVADHLPADAHLVGFRGDADSLVLEGEARRAGTVFESLQKAPGVLAVRADAPIRQEARDSGPAIERFTLAARLGADSTGATQ